MINHPRQAILVTFIGPTEANLNPRYRARCEAGSLVRECDDDVDHVENAHRAAIALCKRIGWDPGELVSGSLPGGKGYVYVSANMGAPAKTKEKRSRAVRSTR